MEDHEEQRSQFFGVIKSARSFINLIKSINIKNIATCYIHDEGMTLTVEESRCVKATAYFKSHMFQVYRKQSDTDIPMFGLPLNALIDCFGLMLPHTNVSKALTETCDIRYNGLGSYLSLKRYDKDHGQTISCNLTPIEPEEEEVDALTGTDIHIQKMILKSDWLISVIGELDKTCESIAFTFSPNDPSFTLRAIGTTGTSETSYPENSDPFISFECDRELTFSYLYSHIIMCKKALEHSVEVSVEMSLNGLLCMLFQIEGSNDTKDFVEFTFLPTGPTID